MITDRELGTMFGRSPKAWFAPKRLGYGSGLPIAWQGWMVLGVYFIGVTLACLFLSLVAEIVCIVIATILLAIVCAKTTDGGWRWRDGS
jgi:hypothetical protein